MSDNADKTKLFRKIKAGEVGALIDFVDGERLVLYDYLLRMTGQVNRSIDCIDDALQAMHEEALATVESAHELRLLLYATARRLVSDIWRADTSSLKNASLEASPSQLSADDVIDRDLQGLRAVDKAFRALAGAEREAVSLRLRCGFEFNQMAQLMECSADAAEHLYLAGMQRIDAECPGLVVGPEASLERMPPHPLPERTSQATINLSMVMEGIKTKPEGLRSPRRIAAVLAILLLILAYLVYPHVFTEMFDLLTAPSE